MLGENKKKEAMKINLYDAVELDGGRIVAVVADDVAGFLLCEDESKVEDESASGKDCGWIVSVPIFKVKRVIS